MQDEHRARPLARPLTLAILTLAVMLVPAVGADHIRVMAVYQAGSNANEVTIHVDFNPTGNCCGGYFEWSTGESPQAYGSLWDGFESGNYQSDVTAWQTGTLSDGRPFHWQRHSIPPTGSTDPNLVRLIIRYTYHAAGAYHVVWYDCCVDSQGDTVVVAGAPAPVTRIAALDNVGSTQARNALDGAGFSACSLSAGGICYEIFDPSSFAAADLARTASGGTDSGRYKALYVVAKASPGVLSALALRAQAISDFAAAGGGVVAYGQTEGLTSAVRWGWLPEGGSFADTVASGNGVHLTANGQAHRSHLNQVDATLSNWGWSRVNHFTAAPSYIQAPPATGLAPGPLTVDSASASQAISYAGAYNGRGCVFASGQPVDIVANSASTTGPGITAKEGALMLFRSSMNYALEC